MKRIILQGCIGLFITATPVCAQDDVLEKIKQLEQQLQELKLLKEQQSVSDKKSDDCMKVVSREKFCSCVGVNLPREVSFEQYVHIMLTNKEDLKYSTLNAEQKLSIDNTIAVRDTCIEKGFFK